MSRHLAALDRNIVSLFIRIRVIFFEVFGESFSMFRQVFEL